MGYLHIDNLYKAQEILAFRECYALEKIHGTSAHIQWSGEKIGFFSGGVNYENFVKCFDPEMLTQIFREKVTNSCVIFGEAYGGKCQGMSKIYGHDLRFVAFDVCIEKSWLSVPQANDFVTAMCLEFVHFNKISTDITAIDAERDAPSVQAIRNNIGEDRMREGIVLRPLFEVTLNNGKRVMAKHKRSEFSERKSIPDLDPTKRQILEDAEIIAFEWVTPMRLSHVLDKLEGDKDISLTGKVITAMIEDVTREAEGEIIENKSVKKAIGSQTAKIYKEWLNKKLSNVHD
jgi:hypothetical protein